MVDRTLVEVLKLWEFAVCDLAVCLDLTKMDHDAGYELMSRPRDGRDLLLKLIADEWYQVIEG